MSETDIYGFRTNILQYRELQGLYDYKTQDPPSMNTNGGLKRPGESNQLWGERYRGREWAIWGGGKRAERRGWGK